MDLSHWDLIDKFSIQEAATLAAGVDPLLIEDRSSHTQAKISHIYRQLYSAYTQAWFHADFHIVGVSQPDDISSLREEDRLPSMQLIRAVETCLKHNDAALPDGLEADDEDVSITFRRDDLARWFAKKGFTPAYDFSDRRGDVSARSGVQLEIGTKERATLLTIIGLLASEARLDCSKASKSAEAILALADKAGITLGKRTIEEHLKKVHDAMERRGR